jgi:dTMP kinase
MAKLPNGKQLPGKLFVVEGIDGSGKSTQLDLLRKWLIGAGYCVAFSEWNSSPVVRATTRRGKKKQLLSPTTFSLIHAADFADRMERQMLPALKAGAIVLADRYMYTAFARDVVRGVHPQWVRKIYAFAVQPTVAFYFRVPLEESINRIMFGRPKLKYYEAGLDLGLSSDPNESFALFQERIVKEYEKMVDEFGLTAIDAMLPLTEQQEMIREIVAPHLRGVLKAERSAWRDVLTKEQLYGRYLQDIGVERGQK